MTYRVFYGDGAAVAEAVAANELYGRDGVSFERFSTEHEALRRARELLEEDERAVVAIRDASGNRLSGVRLQLRLGYCCE